MSSNSPLIHTCRQWECGPSSPQGRQCRMSCHNSDKRTEFAKKNRSSPFILLAGNDACHLYVLPGQLFSMGFVFSRSPLLFRRLSSQVVTVKSHHRLLQSGKSTNGRWCPNSALSQICYFQVFLLINSHRYPSRCELIVFDIKVGVN